jgi:transposase
MTEVRIHTEEIDDIPLLFEFLQQMGIQETLDNVVNHHGNHKGLSMGWLATAWLSYIVSEADHRMVEVETWAEEHIQTLSALIPKAVDSVSSKDFTDDRLADVLEWLSRDNVWEEVEDHLSQHLVQVYDLHQEPIRLDSTTASVYHDTEDNTLFRNGYSKDHRPDLPQFKVMLGTLDPMGMPLATLVLPGNEADDGLYIPTVIRARQALGCGSNGYSGHLYVGDSKMGALETRSFIQAGGDYYLTPLAQVGDVPELMEELLKPVWDKEQSLELIYPPTDMEPEESDKPKAIALGYETTRSQKAMLADGQIQWEERVLVVYSPSLARNVRRGLSQRLDNAEQSILALTPPRGRGKRQKKDLNALQSSIRAILKKHRVEGLLDVSYSCEREKRSVRKYGSHPTRTEEHIRYVVQVRRNEQAIREARRAMGWRLYVTNAPVGELPLSRAVNVFRRAPVMERNFARLKGRPLGIHPLYIRREDHVCGMVRLLSLALRVLTLVEHVARKNLQSSGERLSGLYAGNPKRQTATPTTERLLKAFGSIHLNVVQLPNQTIYHVTPLSDLQKRILALLNLPLSIYERMESALDID